MIDDAKINTLTVMTMEVPCCSGLIDITKKALENAIRKIQIKEIIILNIVYKKYVHIYLISKFYIIGMNI